MQRRSDSQEVVNYALKLEGLNPLYIFLFKINVDIFIIINVLSLFNPVKCLTPVTTFRREFQGLIMLNAKETFPFISFKFVAL